MLTKYSLFYQVIAIVTVISVSGCSDNQTAQKTSSDIPATSVPATAIPKASVSATSPPDSRTSVPSAANKPKEQKYDPRSEAAAVFQGGAKLSDKDIAWFINAKPGDDKYGLNLYMSHDFFDLSDDEKNRLTQKYLKQWKYSLKEVEIKVPQNSTLTINFYDVMNNQFVKSVTNDGANEQ